MSDWVATTFKANIFSLQDINIIDLMLKQVDLPFHQTMFVGDKSNMTENSLRTYVHARSEQMHRDVGEVVCIAHQGYDIIRTVYSDVLGSPIVKELYSLRDARSSATLVYVAETNTGALQYQIVNTGTIKQMRDIAHQILRNELYKCANQLYIVTKNKVLQCGKNVVHYNNTIKKSTDEILVTERCQFLVYGWTW